MPTQIKKATHGKLDFAVWLEDAGNKFTITVDTNPVYQRQLDSVAFEDKKAEAILRFDKWVEEEVERLEEEARQPKPSNMKSATVVYQCRGCDRPFEFTFTWADEPGVGPGTSYPTCPHCKVIQLVRPSDFGLDRASLSRSTSGTTPTAPGGCLAAVVFLCFFGPLFVAAIVN